MWDELIPMFRRVVMLCVEDQSVISLWMRIIVNMDAVLCAVLYTVPLCHHRKKKTEWPLVELSSIAAGRP